MACKIRNFTTTTVSTGVLTRASREWSAGQMPQMPMRHSQGAGHPANDPAFPTPGIVTDLRPQLQRRVARGGRSSRFVMQSHNVSAPIASPGALFVAAAIAVALYLVGRRISD